MLQNKRYDLILISDLFQLYKMNINWGDFGTGEDPCWGDDEQLEGIHASSQLLSTVPLPL